MKRCPSCQRSYADDSQLYCLEDGSALLDDTSGPAELAATLIIPEPRITIPENRETFRPATGPPPQPFSAPPQQQQAWPPVPSQHMSPVVGVKPGRSLAITAIVLAIIAFVLLGFCIISGASKVDPRLIGGVFLFSVCLALAGAISGIVAISKSSKDTSAQNAKGMSVVALVLNGLYLLMTVVFLIIAAVAGSG